jgi:hypothetical protein
LSGRVGRPVQARGRASTARATAACFSAVGRSAGRERSHSTSFSAAVDLDAAVLQVLRVEDVDGGAGDDVVVVGPLAPAQDGTCLERNRGDQCGSRRRRTSPTSSASTDSLYT